MSVIFRVNLFLEGGGGLIKPCGAKKFEKCLRSYHNHIASMIKIYIFVDALIMKNTKIKIENNSFFTTW